MATEPARESSRLFGDAADKQCVTIATDQVETVAELRALKARRAREHFVDEMGEARRKVVQWTVARESA